MKKLIAVGLLIQFFYGTVVIAEDCTSIAQYKMRGQNCSQPGGVSLASIFDVLKQMASSERPGGRRLETPEPLDMAAAQANMSAALADAQVKSNMDKVDQETSDEALRILYKAAILDDAGFYLARDMLKIQLKDKLL